MVTKLSKLKKLLLSAVKRAISATATAASPRRPDPSPGALVPKRKMATLSLRSTPPKATSFVDIGFRLLTRKTASPRGAGRESSMAHYFASDDHGKFTYLSRLS